MNQRGEKPESLGGKSTTAVEVPEVGYQNVVGQDDLTRFDKKRNNRPRGNDRGERRGGNRNGMNSKQSNRNATVRPGDRTSLSAKNNNNDRKNSDSAAQ